MCDKSAILDALADDADLLAPNLRDWARAYLKNHRQRFLETSAFLDDTGTLLDVGCLPGHFTVLLKKLGFAVTGIDIAPERAAAFWEKHGLEVIKIDIERERLPFPDASFSCICFLEILEHLRVNPLHALHEIRRVLAPGGTLLLSLPNITPWDRLRFLFGRDYQGNPVIEFQKLTTLGHMGHIRLYSLEEVQCFLEAVGLRYLEHAYVGNLPTDRRIKLLSWLYPAGHFKPYLLVKASTV